MMYNADLIFSLGPNCRNSFNIRRYFNTERAYPFDWWITSAKSVLHMLEPAFRFSVSREDLFLSRPDHHNSAYNRKLNLLHHHDFPRSWANGLPGVILEIRDEDIENINQKYQVLFDRMLYSIRSSANPVAIINGTSSGFKPIWEGFETNPDLNGPISTRDFAIAARDHLGKKLKVLDISIGSPEYIEEEWGWCVRQPDTGLRELAKDLDWAEPTSVFEAAYVRVMLSLHSDDA